MCRGGLISPQGPLTPGSVQFTCFCRTWRLGSLVLCAPVGLCVSCLGLLRLYVTAQSPTWDPLLPFGLSDLCLAGSWKSPGSLLLFQIHPMPPWHCVEDYVCLASVCRRQWQTGPSCSLPPCPWAHTDILCEIKGWLCHRRDPTCGRKGLF